MQVMLYITATTETITAVVWLLQLPYMVNDSKILFRTLLFSIVTHFMALIGSCVHTYVCMYVCIKYRLCAEVGIYLLRLIVTLEVAYCQ